MLVLTGCNTHPEIIPPTTAVHEAPRQGPTARIVFHDLNFSSDTAFGKGYFLIHELDEQGCTLPGRLVRFEPGRRKAPVTVPAGRDIAISKHEFVHMSLGMFEDSECVMAVRTRLRPGERVFSYSITSALGCSLRFYRKRDYWHGPSDFIPVHKMRLVKGSKPARFCSN